MLFRSDIKTFGYPEKMRNALNSNVFGWFEKYGRYDYGLSVKGLEALDGDEFKELIDFYRQEIRENINKSKGDKAENV